jgi:uncharacterized protein (TIGR02300 family)
LVSAELGTKRTCPSCAARFYDLLKNPIVCPKCGVTFVAEALLPSKGEHAAPVHKVREPVVADEAEEADVELVSLEDVDEGGDDEAEDVEIGGGEIEGDEVFLEEEEEEGNVSGIIGGGKAAGEEEP